MTVQPPTSTLFPYTTLFRSHPELVHAALGYWPLALSVLVGGQIGTRLGVQLLPPVWLRRLTAALIFYVDRKSTRLNSSHTVISYAVFCLKKKNTESSWACCS